MKVTRTSIISGKTSTREINIDPRHMQAWDDAPPERRPLIQHAAGMASLSEDDREFILSGITPDEWASVFGEE